MKVVFKKLQFISLCQTVMQQDMTLWI